MLEDKMTHLKRELINSALLAENLIDKSIKGLLNRQRDLLIDLIENDERKADDYENELDELCTNMIAQYEPKAKNLRLVMMIYTINKDLERMADHGVNIAESALYLISKPALKPLIDIPRMAEMCKRMLSDGINAFVNEDVGLAKAVVDRDNEVDQLWEQIFRELVTFMMADPGAIERALHLIRISHNLERIADLSTNICEDVIYIVEGRDIKHQKSDEDADPEGNI